MGKPTKEYLYGINSCFEVIRAGHRRIMGAFLNQSISKNPRIKKLATLLESKEIPIDWVEKGRLIDLCNSREHQGIVMKTSPYVYTDFHSLLTRNKLLMLDNVEDPHNVGGILRSAEVFGFHGVLLPHRGVPEVYPSIVKVSTGATEFLQIAREKSANQYVKYAMDEGFKIVALDAKGKTDLGELKEVKFEKMLLIIGGEDKGVGQFILNLADYVISIKQFGRINSLNASVAAGVAMHATSQLVAKEVKE